VKHPEAPEPWPEGIEVVVLPCPDTYVKGSFGPGAAGLISALEERGIAVAAVGDPRHAYSYADLGWYGPTIVYPTSALCDGTMAILADAVITAIRSRSSRGNETTRTHLTVGRTRHDSTDIEWLDFRGPAEDLDPALRHWIYTQRSRRGRIAAG
jgi:hypothetical protein